MARYTGPNCRLCRRTGEKLMLKGDRCFTKCTLDKRAKTPGMHEARRKTSERGLQLRAKQKVRYSYGLMERQFKRFFEEAERQAGVSGDNLIVLLERRIDNVVYRLGFADSRAQSRQIVRHGFIMVNGRRLNIPSALVSEGSTVSFSSRAQKTEYYKNLAESIKNKVLPRWLSLDKDKMVGRVIDLPIPEDVGTKFDMALVVEYYSR